MKPLKLQCLCHADVTGHRFLFLLLTFQPAVSFSRYNLNVWDLSVWTCMYWCDEVQFHLYLQWDSEMIWYLTCWEKKSFFIKMWELSSLYLLCFKLYILYVCFLHMKLKPKSEFRNWYVYGLNFSLINIPKADQCWKPSDDHDFLKIEKVVEYQGWHMKVEKLMNVLLLISHRKRNNFSTV